MDTDIHIAMLKKQQSRALKNAKRQRIKEGAGIDVRVRSSFWEQVARDYSWEIKALQKTGLQNVNNEKANL